MFGLCTHEDLHKQNQAQISKVMKIFISNFPDTSAMPQLNLALTRIQLCYIPDSTFLMVEDWDWLVVLQCLQDHNQFKSHPQRPPLSDFETWLNDNHIPQLLAHCSVYQMSKASRKLCGDRYPWSNTKWNPRTLVRWRVLYRHLERLLKQLTDQSTQNFV